MSSRLDRSPQVWRLAADLGLARSDSPSRAIRRLVIKRIQRTAAEFRCASLGGLLAAAAGEVDTAFEEIHSDDDLEELRERYVRAGEKGFANLESELGGTEDFAVTIKRTRQQSWERLFVSVIDCRGEKRYRRYFSKWHELAHLLTLTSQMRLVFRRTHSGEALQDPEEQLMDVIAGDLGFLPEFLGNCGRSEVTFDGIERIRAESCPEASIQSATIGIVRALPAPCLLLEAKLALSKRQEAAALNLDLEGMAAAPKPALRVSRVTVNEAAKALGIVLPRNWRVPKNSLIARVFESGGISSSTEDLSWWVTSDGRALDPRPVRVEARGIRDGVQALLIPQEEN